jgi:quinol monooxygenase YgiN
MSKISIVGDFTTKAGAFDEFYALMVKHATASRQEPGNLRFDVFVPLKSENRLMIYELYEDQAALDAHAGTDRIKEHRNNTKELVENRSLHICDLRDSGDM